MCPTTEIHIPVPFGDNFFYILMIIFFIWLVKTLMDWL